MNARHSNPQQRGVSLLFALLALAALSLATLALVRSVDTGGLVMGNIGFKQDATATGDQATRQAVAWLKANITSLDNDAATNGYYASTKELNADKTTTRVDATGQQFPSDRTRKLIDWDNDTRCDYATAGTFASCTLKTVSVDDINGNKMSYVIFRLCASSGDSNDDLNNSCSKPLSGGGGSSNKGSISYGRQPIAGGASPYYRVVVRVLGARNTTSFTESIVSFQ
ncbi:pilus assembly protein PilX [Variovorax sp. J22R24]|uniref:pilus assembly protein PilX n=1 Tax=Variovorax gracilis TaxID=3053502 RepID=UPI002575481D|nr:pilus assembly protein PilX [Variovorax sp. J22R24]MDM0106029.1 pilus assembly protein PilX [Variovorax sp. J22R24]